MAETLLSDLPAEAQEMLVGMSRANLELLACEIRGHQFEAQVAAFPADADAAAEGARAALRRPAQIEREEPLNDFLALWRVLQTVLVYGATYGDPGEADFDALHRMTEIADDLLRAHVAAVGEAELRLRAFTHPPAARPWWQDATTPETK